ncbi:MULTISPECIES: AraC family transcriptional regulator [unclassified Variovorax]|uniref:AraC family transcriptional regulator n=1 Tax=unclassified Variovorax TaxID=663243 RepID=UPI001BD31F61|nr:MULTISPECIES: AraC family transcriptional regulator [unclassified Variovorax]
MNILHGLQKAGIDLAEAAASAHLTVEDLKKSLGEEQADRFFTAAYESLGDPAAGLAIGMQMRPELFGVVGFSVMTCPNFGAALARIVRYTALASACNVELVQDAREIEVRMHCAGPQRSYSRCRMDIQMGALLSFGRLFTGQPITPLRLALRGEHPPYHARYAEVFSCPALFEQPHDAIVFRRADLDLPLVGANPQVTALFDDAAERDLLAWRMPRSMTKAVRDALREMLRGELPTIEQVASRLCVSERTLQRRLAREGAQFTALLDEVRLEMARHHLAAGRASLTEIAYLLGFVDPNSFFRSFKRWTGQTPDVYRSGAALPSLPLPPGAHASGSAWPAPSAGSV